MSDTMKFPIPNEVLDPYIREAVAASIAGALGDGTEVINKAVQSVLSEKVDGDGNKTRWPTKDGQMLVEVIAFKAVREVAVEVVTQMAQRIRPQIEAQVSAQLRERMPELAKMLVDGAVTSLDARWNVEVKIGSI